MKRVVAGLALLVGAAPTLAAQSTTQPNLVLSVSAGLTTGGPLWELPRHPLDAPGGAVDTIGLSRVLRPALTVMISGTYHRGPHLGITAEMGYFGVDTESRCAAPAAFAPDSENRNEQKCNVIQGQHHGTSVVGFQGGAVYRFTDRGPVSPYLRATAGLGVLSTSYVETAPVISSTACVTSSGRCAFVVLLERDRTSLTWVGTLAAGLTIAAGSGYQVRAEVRDFVTALPVPTGPLTQAQSTAAPTTLRTKHVITVTAGFDVVLERRHRRRY